MGRYGQHWPTQSGDSPRIVREAAAVIRDAANSIVDTKFEEQLRRSQMTRLAADLDVLADRYETEAA